MENEYNKELYEEVKERLKRNLAEVDENLKEINKLISELEEEHEEIENLVSSEKESIGIEKDKL